MESVSAFQSDRSYSQYFSKHNGYCRPGRKYRGRRHLNFVYLHKNRELQENDWRLFGQKAQVSHSLIKRLGLTKELTGHCGCVNCIEFNENGNFLLSGSDDFNIILWDVHKRRMLKSLSTGHRGNIFSVKFLPQTDDSMIVSGAGDCRIEVREIQLGEVTQVCTCHAERIKRIATVPSAPSLFFSASEDGTVMQFDMRTKHSCSSQPNNVLINLKQHAGRTAECKCVAVHPLRSEMIAVGASDPYIRVYDRRMIKLTSIQYPPGGITRTSWERRNYTANQLDSSTDNLPPGCVQFFVPGHLPSKMKLYCRRYRTLATTYLAYSADGAHLLANLGGDHIYLFSMHVADVPLIYSAPPKPCHEQFFNGFTSSKAHVSNSHYHETYPHFSLDQKDETLWEEAMRALDAGEHTASIEALNTLLLFYEDDAELILARAGALMERKWDGDYYSALRDCNKALALSPTNSKTIERQLICMDHLGFDKEVQQYMKKLEEQAPELCNTIRSLLSHGSGNNSSGSERDRDEDDGMTIPSMPSQEKDWREMARDDRDEEDRIVIPPMSSQEDGIVNPPITSQEKEWRKMARDFEKVFNGHCNTTTDIKEAVFVGKGGQFIAAGSDDGNLFLWDRNSTNLVKVIRADNSIVNCVQAHPNICMLATSGIESVVKLWEPQAQPDEAIASSKINLSRITQENQKRMSTDPYEMMILQMGDFVEGWVEVNNDSDAPLPPGPNRMQCRTC